MEEIFSWDLRFLLPGPCRHSFRHEWLFPLSRVRFEGREFPAPRIPEMVLYGPVRGLGECCRILPLCILI